MKTPLSTASFSHRDRGSRFTGYLFPAPGREAFGERLQELRSEHHDATHHCHAWRIGPEDPQEFASDDGEPSGTAGAPILGVLRSADLVNAGLVVVRWYGGTNLGTSGLIEAYGHTAGGCVEEARLREVRLFRRIRLRYPYPEQNLVDRLRHRYGLEELKADYREEVTLELGCPTGRYGELRKELQQAEHRGVSWEDLGVDHS